MAETELFEENYQDDLKAGIDESGDHGDVIEVNDDNGDDGNETSGESNFIVNMHGLPYSITFEEIADFLEGCNIFGGTAGVHFCYSDCGRVNGDAFVELTSQEDLTSAIAKNKQHIGHRYIDVYQVDRKEMEYVLKRNSLDAVQKRIASGDVECVVRLRGLPFGCTKEEIANFFLGLAISPNGILIVTDHVGRAAGDGFVQFTSPELVDQALEKHKEKIGHRYIEVFRSTTAEMNKRSMPPSLFNSRAGPYDRPEYGSRMGRFGGRVGNIKGYGGGGYGGGMYGGGRDYGRDYGGYGGGRYGRDPYESRRFGGGFGGGRGDFRSSRLRDFQSSTDHYVYMRGLPYSATERDIQKFFSLIVPVKICFEYGADGRPSGNANVDFDSDVSAREAMKKHKSLIEKRYIELFLNGDGAFFR